jgi:flagellar hook-basal body complex protein FliE
MNQINPINPIGPLQDISQIGQVQKARTAAVGQPSFKDTLDHFVNDVNLMQNKASESIEKLAAGEITDVHQVMNTAEEANVAFNMMMEIRNKVVDAYNELMRMRL